MDKEYICELCQNEIEEYEHYVTYGGNKYHEQCIYRLIGIDFHQRGYESNDEEEGWIRLKK